MNYDPVFDSSQNQALLAVCARRTIRGAAIAGIVWGIVNLGIGFFAIQVNPINLGLLALALLMLGTGIAALNRPSLHALLAEAAVSVLLFVWNVAITAFNLTAGNADHVTGHGLILPAIAAVVFFKQYRKLGHLKETIAGLDRKTVEEATNVCKQLFKSKLKESPTVVEASSRRCRMKFMKDSVFCVQRNLARAFHLNGADFQRCITDPGQKKLRLVVRHPLGKLTYAFDKKNSEKIKSWLGAGTMQPS